MSLRQADGLYGPSGALGIARKPAMKTSFLTAETITLLNSITTDPDSGQIQRINAMFTSLKSNEIWDKLDALYVLAAPDAQTALLNWKNPGTFDATATNSPTFTAYRGYTFDGATNYLEIINPTAATFFTQDSAHISVWTLITTIGLGPVMGWNDGTDATLINPAAVDGKVQTRINGISTAQTAAGVSSDASGFYLGNRPSSTEDQLYKNNTTLISSHSSTSQAVNNVALNIGRSTATAFCAQQVAAATVGGSLTTTEVLVLYRTLRSYLRDLGATAL